METDSNKTIKEQHIKRKGAPHNKNRGNKSSRIPRSNRETIKAPKKIYTNYPWYPDALVLGPGKLREIMMLGALYYLSEENFLKNVRCYSGVNAGAVISLLLVAGYTIEEILKVTSATSIFQNIDSININDIRENAGFINNEKIKKLLSSLIAEKFGKVLNLQQLYMATGCEYYAATYNMTHKRGELLSRHTEPQLSCVEAALFSMNVPLIYYEIVYRGCIYIDGTFTNPYPIKHLDNGSTNILGIYISNGNNEIDDHNPIRFAFNVMSASYDQIKTLTENSCSPASKHLTLVSPLLPTLGLTINNETRALLLAAGYKEASRFTRKILHPELYNVLPPADDEEIPIIMEDSDIDSEDYSDSSSDGEDSEDGEDDKNEEENDDKEEFVSKDKNVLESLKKLNVSDSESNTESDTESEEAEPDDSTSSLSSNKTNTPVNKPKKPSTIVSISSNKPVNKPAPSEEKIVITLNSRTRRIVKGKAKR